MQTQCQHLLADHRYQQYEISAFAKNGKQCLHNNNYWLFGDYIGIGAGAHGKLSSLNEPDGSLNIIRKWKHRQPRQYIEKTLSGNALSGEQILDQQDIVFEFLLNALRLKSGSDIKTFESHTGLDFEVLKNTVKNIDPKLLLIDAEKVCTTDKGFLFLNEILERLV